MADTDLADVWARSLDGLAELHVQPSQLAWLKLTRPLGLVENTALIATPNAFVKEQLETRLRPLVTHALSRELGRPIQLAVTVDPSTAAPPEPPPGPPGLAAVGGITGARRCAPVRRASHAFDPGPARPAARPAVAGAAAALARADRGERHAPARVTPARLAVLRDTAVAVLVPAGRLPRPPATEPGLSQPSLGQQPLTRQPLGHPLSNPPARRTGTT